MKNKMKMFKMIFDGIRYLDSATKARAAINCSRRAEGQGEYIQALRLNNIACQEVFECYQILRRWEKDSSDEENTLEYLTEKGRRLSFELNFGVRN